MKQEAASVAGVSSDLCPHDGVSIHEFTTRWRSVVERPYVFGVYFMSSESAYSIDALSYRKIR